MSLSIGLTPKPRATLSTEGVVSVDGTGSSFATETPLASSGAEVQEGEQAQYREGTSEPIDVVAPLPMMRIELGVLAVALVIVVVLLIRSISAKKKAAVTQYTEMEMNELETNEMATASDSGWYVCAAQTMGTRKRQEDALCYSNVTSGSEVNARGIFAAMADGIGGMSDGQRASTTVVRRLLADFLRASPAQGVSQNLLGLLADAHQALLSVNQESPNKSGTTLVCVWIWENVLHFVSVGDSRLYLYRDGGLIQLNREHVLGARLNERLQPATVESQRRRNSLTSYIGKKDLKLVDRNTRPISIYPGDRLLLMSDGVFGTLSEAQMIQGLAGEAHKSADNIIQMVDAQRKSSQDNATVILIGR